MPRQREYYTLVASLPPLTYTEQVERMPINEVRLNERLSMLAPDDLALVERMEAVLAWERHPVERTDAEVVSFFQQITAHLASANPALMEIIEYPMHVRTIMAALRRRHRGLPAPSGEPWGIGPWTHHIERHWEDPDFKLSAVFPWIPQARQYLAGEETLNLERMMLRLIWDRVHLLTQQNMFEFVVVLAYLLKWDVLLSWHTYDHKKTQTRFDALVTEVLGEHDRLFD